MTTQQRQMTRPSDNEATFCPTKAGNGYKFVVKGVWFYVSKRIFLEALRKGTNVTFHTIDDNAAPNVDAQGIPLDA